MECSRCNYQIIESIIIAKVINFFIVVTLTYKSGKWFYCKLCIRINGGRYMYMKITMVILKLSGTRPLYYVFLGGAIRDSI